MLHQTTYVGLNLLRDDVVLYGALGKTQRTQHIVARIRLVNGLGALLRAEIIYNLIVRNTQYPREKLAIINISALVDDTHHLDERLLKYVIGHVSVLDHHTDVVAHAA